jgi:peptidoglycan/xylan/chitin deacetylase (PgdA/CDA1 family)
VSECALHGVTARSGSHLAEWLESTPHLHERLAPTVRAFSKLVFSVSGPGDVLDAAGAGLPDGAARAEALAVRLRRRGVRLEWAEPHAVFTGVDQLLDFCRRRGASSVEVMRSDPDLVTELQLGSWFHTSWRRRSVRRIDLRTRLLRVACCFRTLADAAFWTGVRDTATPAEWNRLTRSSYVALVYHRLAGEQRQGQEQVDLAPDRFDAQLGLLRRLGFVPLTADEIRAFHREPGRTLPRRSFVVTVDDGFRDCLEPLARQAGVRPQLFVSTSEVGGSAHWLDGEPVLSWDELRQLEQMAVAIGSHASVHRRLTTLTEQELTEDLTDSLSRLHDRLERPIPILAYPNGAFDDTVRHVASAAGFEAAYSTEKGRNGAGTDPYCLRRVSVHSRDGRLAVLWKVMTGETLPLPFWIWRRFSAQLRGALRWSVSGFSREPGK